MSEEVPLNDEQIKAFLDNIKFNGQKLNNNNYNIIEIANDSDFKNIQYKKHQNKLPFFQIIHENREENGGKRGIIKEIKIQPNHYSLLVYYDNEVYYFDPSYDLQNLYVCNKIEDQFKNQSKNIHIMETKLI